MYTANYLVEPSLDTRFDNRSCDCNVWIRYLILKVIE